MPLLEHVLGRSDVDLCEAQLTDYQVFGVKDQPFPILIPHSSSVASGVLAANLTQEDLDRLAFYEGGFGYSLVEITVSTPDGPRPAQVFLPPADMWVPSGLWDLDQWVQDWGRVSLFAAREMMVRYGQMSAEQAQTMLPFFRGRGWARELAAQPGPQTLRSARQAHEVEITPDDRPSFHGFFNLETFTLRYPHFDGSMSKSLPRECFISFDVALVLPYDPVLDKVLLIEQLRYGPILRGDPAPWVLEPVAGLVDLGETPLEAAHRETAEEAGLEVLDMIPVPAGYASPGYSTEYYHCFIGLCDLSGRDQELGGLDAENEDIRNHTIPFEQAMQLLDSGEITTAPLAMLIYALAAKRDQLRGGS